jgi:diacylglycerol kinase family enzyme
MRFIAIFNKHGGTFRTMDVDAFCADAERIFSAEGHDIDCRPVEGEALMPTLEQAANDPEIDVILAGGGDGTISAAAAIAFEHGKVLAVLPAGTMNLFARSLQVPLDLHQALQALASGEVADVDIATANGKPFVHQFSVGLHARMVRIRENMTYKSRWGKMLASARAAFAVIRNPPRFRVDLKTPHGVERRETSGVNISNNPLGEGHLPYADRLDQGVLGVYVAKAISSWALVRLAFSIASGHWKQSPMVSVREVSEVTLHFPKRKRSAQAVIDGELIDLPREVDLRVHARGLKVIAPKVETTRPVLAS